MKLVRELYNYRTMLYNLIRKDLVTRYKASALGFMWTFLNPLLQLMVYSLVFSMIMRMQIENYSLFLFVAFIPWFFTSTSITAGSSCILANGNLVQTIYFPRIVIPIAAVTASFVNMLLSMVIVFLALIVAGIGLSAYAFFLPIIMIVQYFFVLGLALVFSAVDVYIRDLQHILDIVVMAWMYLTPVMYPVDMVPEELWWLINGNPMTSIITAYREILFYKRMPDLTTLLTAIAMGIVSTIVGVCIFQKLQRGFAEEL